MFDLHNENLSDKHAKKLKELTAKFEHVEGLLDNLLADHGLSKEEFAAFVENPNHFHDSAWVELQKADQQLSQKLEFDLKQIKNPHSTAQKYKVMRQSQQWLFVR